MDNSPRTPASIPSPSSIFNAEKSNAESESGLALLARLGTRPSLKNLDTRFFPSGAQPCDIIEVSGDSGSGKSALILHLILNALMPCSWHGITLGGCGTGVVFIDSDMHFNILQIENMIQRRIKKSVKTARSIFKGLGKDKGLECDIVYDPIDLQKFLHLGKKQQVEEINGLTRECLKNLQYLKCTDSFQFIVTLLSLEELVLSKDNLSLVVIDSISAFYWYDRTYRADTWYKLEQFYNKIFKVFLGHIKKHKLVLLSSRQALFQRRSGKEVNKNNFQNDDIEDDTTEYEYMGREWSSSITYRINMSIEKYQTHHVSSEVLVKEKIEKTDGDNKLNEERTSYSADVSGNSKKRKIIFTVHEDGIRPFSVKS